MIASKFPWTGGRWPLLSVVLIMAACSGPSPKLIADTEINVVNRHPMCVTLAIRGSDERHIGELKDAAIIYEKALRRAIERSRVFSAICAQGQAGLELSVLVSNGAIDFAASGWRLHGIVTTRWRLANPATRRVFYQETPNSKGIADHGVGGNARQNAAYEAAMRSSIVQGLQDISRLDLSSGK